MMVRIVPSTTGAPAGKLAEAEVYFDDSAGPLTAFSAHEVYVSSYTYTPAPTPTLSGQSCRPAIASKWGAPWN